MKLRDNACPIEVEGGQCILYRNNPLGQVEGSLRIDVHVDIAANKGGEH